MSHGVTLERAETPLGAIELFTFEQHQHAFPRHAHEVLTLGVFGAGNGSIRVRGGTHRAAPGSLLALAPGEVHSAEPSRGRGWTYRSICPSSALLERVFDGAVPTFSFGQPVIDDPALAGEVGAVHTMLSTGPVTLELEVRVVELVTRSVRTHAAPSRTSPARHVATRAATLMESDLAGSLPIAHIAREFGVSPFQLIRAFHAEFGVPPHAYFTQVRLRKARAMLVRGESITAAAYACGFVDQSHLTRVFKRYYGLTPGVFSRC